MPELFAPTPSGDLLIDLPKDPEQQLAVLATVAGRPVPERAQRVYSIAFVKGRETWTATVGEELRGVRARPRTRNGRRVTVEEPLYSSSEVLAIFAGSPYLVVTDSRPLSKRPSLWANPFMAGEPTQVTYFDAPYTGLGSAQSLEH